jgi:hypothetical protein
MSSLQRRRRRTEDALERERKTVAEKETVSER